MIYLDNAATTFPKPKRVYNDADEFYRKNGSYPSRGNYKSANEVSDMIKETRKLMLEFFRADKNYDVVFTSSATISINTILSGYNFRDGMNIYISPFEHNAVVRTLENIKSKVSINLCKLVVNTKDLLYDINYIEKQFVEITPDMVILNHASNVIGLIAPVKEIFSMSKLYNAVNVLDASQTAGILEINIKEIRADFIVFAGHKALYSPFGISGIVLNNSIKINPLIFGGTGFDSASKAMPSEYPERLEPGSISTYSIAGLNSAVKWINQVGIKNIFEKEALLLRYALSELTKLKNVKCYIPSGEQIALFSFIVRGYSSDEVCRILNNHGIEVRAGLHCSPDTHKLIGTYPSGTVRIGISYFNDKSDIKSLIDVIKKLL